jgi:hypothetical protein
MLQVLQRYSRVTAQQFRLGELKARKYGGSAESRARLALALCTMANVQRQRLGQRRLESNRPALASCVHYVKAGGGILCRAKNSRRVKVSNILLPSAAVASGQRQDATSLVDREV